jgi:hypothetical protein
MKQDAENRVWEEVSFAFLESYKRRDELKGIPSL